MKHFLTTADYSRSELAAIIEDARNFKSAPYAEILKGKTVALLFLNNSLRTRTSFDIGVHQLGGHAIILSPSGGMWPLEFEDGVVMDGDAEEHICEAAKVLSRYCDIIGVRAFPKFEDWNEDRKDKILTGFAKYAQVPIINMETITHPCQELAHIMVLEEKFGSLDGRKYVLSWVYHPKPLNTAVANSALMIATKFGMEVSLLCPTPDYRLDERYMRLAEANAAAHGRALHVTHDIDEAYAGADIIYAKSWGAIPFFGKWAEEKPIRDAYRHFIVDKAKMDKTNDAVISHCLPMRRNVKISDAVFDSPACIAYEEAENRLHVQKAIMKAVI